MTHAKLDTSNEIVLITERYVPFKSIHKDPISFDVKGGSEIGISIVFAVVIMRCYIIVTQISTLYYLVYADTIVSIHHFCISAKSVQKWSSNLFQTLKCGGSRHCCWLG